MDNGLFEILLSILGLVITIASAIITRYLIPWLKEKYGIEKITKATTLTKIIVNAVEQIYDATTKAGLTKKADALTYLKSMNLGFTDDQLSLLIEQAVKQMNEEKKIIEASI